MFRRVTYRWRSAISREPCWMSRTKAENSPRMCVHILGCFQHSDTAATLWFNAEVDMTNAEGGPYPRPFSSKPFHLRLKGPMPATAVSTNSTCNWCNLGAGLTVYYIAVSMLSDWTVCQIISWMCLCFQTTCSEQNADIQDECRASHSVYAIHMLRPM